MKWDSFCGELPPASGGPKQTLANYNIISFAAGNNRNHYVMNYKQNLLAGYKLIPCGELQIEIFWADYKLIPFVANYKGNPCCELQIVSFCGGLQKDSFCGDYKRIFFVANYKLKSFWRITNGFLVW